MVEVKEIDLVKNEITYEDYSKVDYGKFYDAFVEYWNKRIAGETITPFDIERFMKRSSSKNLKQLIDGKKAEGFLEATLGKKMNPELLKMILILVLVGVIAAVVVFIVKGMGLM